jgi:2-amino-4-hydroxy-6-hydroxymethyldihydropteridine diphosphokinase
VAAVEGPVRAYVGLGSNLDDPGAQLRAALSSLANLPRTRLSRASRLYRTPPWGRLDQPEFVNAVAELETELTPQELLAALQQIERSAGRERVERWGPRVLDLDLLLHGQRQLDLPGLHLPHPHLHERAFVLMPLVELVPDVVVPGRGRVADLLAAVDCRGIEALG